MVGPVVLGLGFGGGLGRDGLPDAYISFVGVFFRGYGKYLCFWDEVEVPWFAE